MYGGEATGLALADRLRLPFAILEPIIERIRGERLIEVRGATGGSSAASYRYALTDWDASARAAIPRRSTVHRRRARAARPAMSGRCASLAAVARLHRSRAAAKGFSHLVISEHILEQLGPAVNANKAIFLYGPPGNGKSVHRRRARSGDRRRHVHAVRDRHRRPHRHDVRPDQPRAARGSGSRARRASSRRSPGTVGGSASGVRS